MKPEVTVHAAAQKWCG